MVEIVYFPDLVIISRTRSREEETLDKSLTRRSGLLSGPRTDRGGENEIENFFW